MQGVLNRIRGPSPAPTEEHVEFVRQGNRSARAYFSREVDSSSESDLYERGGRPGNQTRETTVPTRLPRPPQTLVPTANPSQYPNPLYNHPAMHSAQVTVRRHIYQDMHYNIPQLKALRVMVRRRGYQAPVLRTRRLELPSPASPHRTTGGAHRSFSQGLIA